QHRPVRRKIECHPDCAIRDFLNEFGGLRAEPLARPIRQEESGSSPEHTEHETLGAKLSYKLSAACPERQPQSDLMLTPRVPRREKVRQIHAADKENQTDRNQEDCANRRKALESPAISLEKGGLDGAQLDRLAHFERPRTAHHG